ncbi:helix-turn-helix domain-containing protein [Shewanella sp. 202IG2-18]|nr:helix-turn-helix domain-containing protein [Parashewanella hymeniacidonis]
MVKKLRENKNWSQEQLAQLAGLSLRTIQRVEAGNRASLETLKSLSSVFEVDISKLTEEIIVLDKNSREWQAEPWYIRAALLCIRKRSHAIAYEYILLVFGIGSWLGFQNLEVTTPIAFLGAYLNLKLTAYIDNKGYW